MPKTIALSNPEKITSRDGVIENDQNMIHEKVFYFSDKKAKHIMTHRTEAELVDLNLTTAHGPFF